MANKSRDSDPQHGFAIDVPERKVNTVRVRIYRHAMSVRSKHSFANFLQAAIAFVEDRNDATLGRHIETMQTWIKSEHVRIRPEGESCFFFLRLKIKDDQFGIVFESRECKVTF